jgi:hypothetical protein
MTAMCTARSPTTSRKSAARARLRLRLRGRFGALDGKQ